MRENGALFSCYQEICFSGHGAVDAGLLSRCPGLAPQIQARLDRTVHRSSASFTIPRNERTLLAL